MDIIVNKLEYIYGKGTAFEKKALQDVNLQIKQGEFIGLIGHTGSGKSTLVRHLDGLLKPTSGGIYVDGKDIHDEDYSLKELRKKIGLVFQYPEHQLFESTVIEDVMFGPKNIGMSQLDMELHSFEALKKVGIGDDLLDVSPFELSGGQKRRVAIAGVLAMDPEVLILDEPTAGLDPQGRNEIYSLIRELHEKSNMTVVVVSHSMEDMADYVQRIIVMDHGTKAYDGTPAEVFSHYKELEAIGLRAPSVTYVVEELAKRGIELPHNAITVEQATDSIMQLYRKG